MNTLQNKDIHSIDNTQSMVTSGTSGCLTGHILVALPHMTQPMFKKTIVLICQHNDDGAIGVIVNHVIEGVRLEHVSTDHDNDDETWRHRLSADKIYWGGPHEVRQGLLVHSPERIWPSTLMINEHLAITPYDELGEGGAGRLWPEHSRLFLGHVHWKPGQLEKDWLHQPWLSFAHQTGELLDRHPDSHWDHVFMSQAFDTNHWSMAHPRTHPKPMASA